jgi:hypothetical protein
MKYESIRLNTSTDFFWTNIEEESKSSFLMCQCMILSLHWFRAHSDENALSYDCPFCSQFTLHLSFSVERSLNKLPIYHNYLIWCLLRLLSKNVFSTYYNWPIMMWCDFLWLFKFHNSCINFLIVYQDDILLKASSKIEISEWFELVDGILTHRLRNFLLFGSLISLFLRISKYLSSLSTADLVLSTLSIHHSLNFFFQINGVLQECMVIQLPAAGVYGDTTPSDIN